MSFKEEAARILLGVQRNAFEMGTPEDVFDKEALDIDIAQALSALSELHEKDKKERLKEIIKIAYVLKWVEPAQTSYPLMQLSEVEKCMLAMVSDFELERMRGWLKDVEEGRLKPMSEKEYLESQRSRLREKK